MAIVFDGKEFTRTLYTELQTAAKNVQSRRGWEVTLVAVVNPDSVAGMAYTNLKAKRAAEIGIRVEKVLAKDADEARAAVIRANEDPTVDGVLVQLPVSESRVSDIDICRLIASEKDVDGLTATSPFIPATARAVVAILAQAHAQAGHVGKRLVVVGSRGMIGSQIYAALPQGWEKTGMDKDDFEEKIVAQADVIVSVTGVPGLITAGMVKEGAVVVDVGFPQGDVVFEEVVKKAAFITPVPGGVGPVTIAMLLANLVEAARLK